MLFLLKSASFRSCQCLFVSGFIWASPPLPSSWSSSSFAWDLGLVLAASASCPLASRPLAVPYPRPSALHPRFTTRSPLANLLSVTPPCHSQLRKATLLPPTSAGLRGDNVRPLKFPPLKQSEQKDHLSSIVLVISTEDPAQSSDLMLCRRPQRKKQSHFLVSLGGKKIPQICSPSAEARLG